MFPPSAPKTRARYGNVIGYPGIPGAKRARQVPPDFRFRVQRLIGQTVVPRTFSPGATVVDEQYVINGAQAQSKNEWYLYKALILVGMPASVIEYQVPWHGGKVLGGQVVDFMLFMGGNPTILKVMGKYWHPTEYGTPLDTFTRYQMLSEGYRVFEIPDKRLQSIDDAVQEIKRLNIV